MARTTTGGEKATKERPEMRRFIRIVALAVALVIPGSAFSQQYPSKPVTTLMTQSGQERAAFAAMHGPDLLVI
jgi:hypothetical protein